MLNAFPSGETFASDGTYSQLSDFFPPPSLSLLIFLILLNKNTFHLPFILVALSSFHTSFWCIRSSQQESSEVCRDL